MNQIELLESRIAPATISGGTLSYTDVDGDSVSVQFSKGTIDASMFTFDNAFASTGAQQLQKIDISGQTAFQNANIFVLVGQNGGDGHTNIGTLDASGIDLKNVIISGDLSRIEVGDAKLKTSALRQLNVNSFGLSGLDTQGADQQMTSNVQGNLDRLVFQEGLSNVGLAVSGKIATTEIYGSISGGDVAGSGTLSAGSLGKFTLEGNLVGGSVANAGQIKVAGNVQRITVLGKILGGAGASSGSLSVGGNLAILTAEAISSDAGIGGGSVMVGKTLGSLTVKNDLTGAAGSPLLISAWTKIGTVKVGGDVTVTNIVAGVIDSASNGFGNADDQTTLPTKPISSIGKIIIAGSVNGTSDSGDHFGFTAERIGSVKIGGTALKVKTGAHNDLIGVEVGTDGDFTVREVPKFASV